MSTFIFISPLAFEPWDYRNPETKGIGGSETAHIELALRLAKKGHQVISYTPLPDDCPNPEFGGVLWRNLDHVDYSQPGIWVASRYPKIVDHFKSSHPNQKIWLVCQDEEYEALTPERIKKFNKIFALCSEHMNLMKQRHPTLTDKVLTQSTNGIRPEWIKQTLKLKLKRNPKRIMYASSPDRGLKAALQIFKKVHEWDPVIEFHFYYGLDNILKFSKGEDQHLANGETIKQLKELSEQPNVFDHGRLGQKELYKEWAQTNIWFYPTNFFETSCITSMEAQALGAIPITAPKGALVDNVGWGIMIPGEVFWDPLTQARYAYWVARTVNSTQETEAIRPQMMEYALNRFSWNNVVTQYEELANGKL